MSTFEKLGIDEDFNPFYEEKGIKKPNEVQLRVIPEIIKNNSTICIAQTGSGKTLAYALPTSELVKKIEDEEGISRKRSKPYAVIVVPTKELAVQVEKVYKEISHHVKLRTRCLINRGRVKSTPLKMQSYEILVATPTKLARAVKSGDVSFEQLKYLVFDEADQLFDMGFKKDVASILYPVEYEKTNIHFFSATLPSDVEVFLNEKFAKKELKRIDFANSHMVQQKVETFNIFVTPKEKNQMLKLFLTKTAVGRGIVFINQKNQVDEVEAFIKDAMPKLRYKVLHGGLTQQERLDNLKSYSAGKAQVLFASDVAARGIDIKDISWVFNYGLPRTAIYYLHRCGRTARAGRAGAVYNLVTSFDSKLISFINDAIKSQSNLSLDLIAKDMSAVRRSTAKKKPAKAKKRVKITKRSR